jgi:DNA sulfur modification protein DndB
VLFHSVLLHAIGKAGAELVAQYPDDWQQRLRSLENVDWSRSNTDLWEGRAMVGGHLSKSRSHVLRTAILLKQIMGVHLTEGEQREAGVSPGMNDENKSKEATV